MQCSSTRLRGRAGCNFSAISGSDANALRWDALGYAHLMKLADHHGQEAFVQRTLSTEYWDDHIPHEKIKAMEGYLEDVGITPDLLNRIPCNCF